MAECFCCSKTKKNRETEKQQNQESVSTYISSHLRTSFCVRVEEMGRTEFEQPSSLSLVSELAEKSASFFFN